ncbi:hypothetical protein ACIBCR_15365 [Micromonospora echinospora]|uniref:hypothetical protein n=1 Tax=Micromonospora echinospora TaxID=1877 RepID=UPI003790EDE3
MARKTAKLCAECNADMNLPAVTPSETHKGFCRDCKPDHTTHLVLAGDFATFCGTPTYEVTADPSADVKAHEPLFGGNEVNCVGCMRALRDKRD